MRATFRSAGPGPALSHRVGWSVTGVLLAVFVCLVVLLGGAEAAVSSWSATGSARTVATEATEKASKDQSPRAYARDAFRVTNRVRANRDRVRTDPHRCLKRFARRHANHLAAQDPSSLDSDDHQALRPVLRRCKLRLAGENIALGYATGREAVRDGWMKSKSHRANILERRYRHMALVSRLTESERWVAVQLFGRKA